MTAIARLTRPLTTSQIIEEIFNQARPARPALGIPMDFYESESAYLVRASIPGFSKEQVSIELEDSTLIVSATREAISPEGFDALRIEGLPVSVRRSVAIPEKIDADKSTARFADGVLELTLPKLAASKKIVKID